MRIGLDLRPFLRRETGIGVYFRNLLFSLSRLDGDNDYVLFSSSFKDRFPRDRIPPFARRTFRDFRFSVRGLNRFWLRFGWPTLDLLFQTRLDLTHSPTPLRLPTRGKTIVTVHDLFALECPDLVNREARLYFGRRLRRSLEKADGVIAVSRFVADSVLARFSLKEDKVKVIRHGLDPRFTAQVPPESKSLIKKRYDLPRRFLLFVGGQEPRKNLIRLLEALRIVRERERDVSLVLAGPQGADTENIEAALRRLGLSEAVFRLDYVAGEDLPVLYRLAALFVLPSLSEGFGLPVLEAMASGVPVAASGRTAIPEVSAGAALYFDPENPEDMAGTILTVLGDSSKRQLLIEAGKARAGDFDWTRAASQTLEFYRDIAGR